MMHISLRHHLMMYISRLIVIASIRHASSSLTERVSKNFVSVQTRHAPWSSKNPESTGSSSSWQKHSGNDCMCILQDNAWYDTWLPHILTMTKHTHACSWRFRPKAAIMEDLVNFKNQHLVGKKVVAIQVRKTSLLKNCVTIKLFTLLKMWRYIRHVYDSYPSLDYVLYLLTPKVPWVICFLSSMLYGTTEGRTWPETTWSRALGSFVH